MIDTISAKGEYVCQLNSWQSKRQDECPCKSASASVGAELIASLSRIRHFRTTYLVESPLKSHFLRGRQFMNCYCESDFPQIFLPYNLKGLAEYPTLGNLERHLYINALHWNLERRIRLI